ncbi:MAG: hypothetical protein WKF85_06610 [Chitinophagaceae bacterium]
MVRIKNGSLVIEIQCKEKDPETVKAILHNGLKHVGGLIDHQKFKNERQVDLDIFYTDIQNDSIVIEIPCKNKMPLAALYEFQSANLYLIRALNYRKARHEPLRLALFALTELLENSFLSPEQLKLINSGLTKEQIEIFNQC